MKKNFCIIFIYIALVNPIIAQHCAPITKTVLREISVIRIDSLLNFQFEFEKSGGQIKEAYQVYLLAYLEKNKNDVFKEEKNANGWRLKQLVNIYNQNTTVILKRSIIKQSVKYDKTAEATIYGYSESLKIKEIFKKIIVCGKLKNENNCWGEFKLAVFIPFLDDEKHSIDQPLPKDAHECNYEGRSFLILQELNYTFKIYSDGSNKSEEKFFIIPIKE